MPLTFNNFNFHEKQPDQNVPYTVT